MQLATLHLGWFDSKSLRSGAIKDRIDEVQQQVGIRFPQQYVEFLELTDGYEGWIGEGYVRLQSTAELADWNKEYAFETAVPGYFAIGSNGGGESFGFDSHSGTFFMIPFIVSSWQDAIEIGSNFNELLSRLYDDKLFDERKL